jgi:hypothetical protein
MDWFCRNLPNGKFLRSLSGMVYMLYGSVDQ